MKYLFIALSFLICVSCSKDEPVDISKGLETKFDQFRASDPCDGSAIEEYNFQGRTVYLLKNTCCCDYYSDVVDNEGNVLGFLGGFEGNTEISGEEFSNAIFIRTVWSK